MGKYYVYLHWDGNVPVYVGKGINDRAWRSTNRRNKEHSAFLNKCFNNNINCVKLIATHLTEEDALELEELILQESDMKFNMTHTKEWYKRLREQSKQQAKRRRKPVTTPLGKFKSITEAANAHGIKRPSATARLKKGEWKYGY
jgi:hypothetical protein